VLFHNLVMLSGPAGKDPGVRDGHLFSAYLMMPLAATTLALLTFNWYPAQVRPFAVRRLIGRLRGVFLT